METDQRAVLTIRAAVNKVIDFSKAKLKDVAWWRRTNILIKVMSADHDLEILKAKYAFNCALVANGNLSEDSFKKIQQEAHDTFIEISNILYPWMTQSSEERHKSGLNEVIEQYKKVFGDPGDPKVMAHIKENLALALKSREDPVLETEEQRVDRLLRDSAEKRKQTSIRQIRKNI